MPIDVISIRQKLRSEVAKALGPGTKGTQGTVKYICPFHKEKTPSFVVWEDHYHCYGCGAHGDVIQFIQTHYNISFKEAAKQLGADTVQDATAIDQVKAQRQAEIVAEEAKRAQARLSYHDAGQWRRYHDAMDAQAREWWAAKGIPPSRQDSWMLGYTPDRPYQVDETIFHSSAFVMPMWSFANGRPSSVQTVQYRLNDPVAGAGRFRFEKGLGTAPFITRQDWHAGETSGAFDGLTACLVVEGPRKAATVRSFVSPHLQVIGIPSKLDTGGVLEDLKKFQFVWVILDPDARIKPANALPTWVRNDYRLCKAIGVGKSAVVSLPDKIDDMLLSGDLTIQDLEFRLKNADQDMV